MLRGFAYGTLSVLAVVALDVGYSETVTAAITAVQSVAVLVGYLVFGLFSRFFSPRLPVFLGSVSIAILPLMLVGNQYVFLALCAFLIFGRTLVDVGVIALMIYPVPREHAGPYNAWRMVLHNLGSLLATAVATAIPTVALLWISVACGVASGFLFLLIPILRRTSPMKIGRSGKDESNYETIGE